MTEKNDAAVETIYCDELQSLNRYPFDPDSFGGQSFPETIAEKVEECERVFIANGWEQKSPRHFPLHAEPFTDMWYAAQIGMKCYTLMNRPREEFIQLDVVRAMTIERLWIDWQWRQAFGWEMKIGKNKRQKTKLAADALNAPHKKVANEIVWIVDEYLKENPKKTTQAFKFAKNRLGLTAEWQSVRRRYNRAKREK